MWPDAEGIRVRTIYPSTTYELATASKLGENSFLFRRPGRSHGNWLQQGLTRFLQDGAWVRRGINFLQVFFLLSQVRSTIVYIDILRASFFGGEGK